MPPPASAFHFQVAAASGGCRLDTLVASEIDQCSRSLAAALIRRGCITVDGVPRKPGYVVKAGETIIGAIPAAERPTFDAEAIPLAILHEDADLLVVNKPAGMVVHPAPGHGDGTLANALLYHCPDLMGSSGCRRPGIVHRLDKDTSGVMVVAKTNPAMAHLAAQFKSRQTRKCYLALVYGVPEAASGTVDRPIGRHPKDRKKMSTVTHTPRAALTHWRVRETFSGASLLELDIRTGRTHQIRVHCKSMGHSIIGDPTYVNRGDKRRLAQLSPRLFQAIEPLDRQMLHAWTLSFIHPVTARPITVTAPVPGDMARLIDLLRSESSQG